MSISCIFCRPLNALIRRRYNFECRCNYAFTRFIKKQIYLCLSLIVIDLATGKVSSLSVLLLTLKTTTKIRHLRRNLVEVLFSPLDSWKSQGKYCVFKTKQNKHIVMVIPFSSKRTTKVTSCIILPVEGEKNCHLKQNDLMILHHVLPIFLKHLWSRLQFFKLRRE